MNDSHAQRTVWFDADRKCPRCGSTLLTNGSLVWCSFVGGRVKTGLAPVPACSFGIDAKVLVEDLGTPQHRG